ncbi:MAG: hypothetical protein EPN93_16620 [Spirochaetes bacterium]|nr:MAG: hypothetical protein EPN93_16620 [Spirochaetota bacterium]
MTAKPYGSGYFGEWMEDEFGLPAYRYTCNQTKDPKAVTPLNKKLRLPTDHIHQIGNDRLVGVASNYGYIQVRQDEGAPKFLNEYDPSNNQFAGGFGYLTDGTQVCSTFYQGQDEGFERVFGAGYVRKTLSGRDYDIDQVIFAPFGDDPLLISQVTVTNGSGAPADLRWIEYWGCQMYQFSFRATIYAAAEQEMGNVVRMRRELGTRFERRIAEASPGRGIVVQTKFTGWSPEQEKRWNEFQEYFGTQGKDIFGGEIRFPSKGIGFEDLEPPLVFLTSLDAEAQGLETDARAFFGRGGPGSPEGLKNPLPDTPRPGASCDGMFLERRFRLEPGESNTMHFAFGYIPEGWHYDTLVYKYKRSYESAWKNSCTRWKENRIELSLADEPWVDRELFWHHYYLRSNMTYDSYFKEHIISQAHVYQYILGFQGPPRDALQHALPFIFCDPGVVKEVLRFVLKTALPDGELPYAVTGRGMRMPSSFHPSDLELWLLWLAAEYVLATKDSDFLNERISLYPASDGESRVETVMGALMRCYTHLVESTGYGAHGLPRLLKGDWNDGIVVEYALNEDIESVHRNAVSVLNGAMASYVLEHFSRMLRFAGNPETAGALQRAAETQREAVRAQWTGKWFRRAWLSPEIGWVGEDMLWLEPQPWSIIGGSATADQAKALAGSIDEHLRRRSPLGACLMSGTLARSRIAPGAGANAGIWPSINGTLIWALSLVDPNMAWDEWKKNSRAVHAERFPDVWYGIWSGPDKINSVFSRYPGQTQFDESLLEKEGVNSTQAYGLKGMNWTDFPVMNMHPHAWPLYSMAKLMGIEFTGEGVRITPRLPKAEYRFASPIAGLCKTASGYSGWYAPHRAGTWEVVLTLSEEELLRFRRLEVNGSTAPFRAAEHKAFTFSGTGSRKQPLRWSLN